MSTHTNVSKVSGEFLVYYLGTQKLRFIAPMPEQIVTPTMHFSKVSGGPCYEPLDPSQKSFIGVPICSGMDALCNQYHFKTRTDFRAVTNLSVFFKGIKM